MRQGCSRPAMRERPQAQSALCSRVSLLLRFAPSRYSYTTTVRPVCRCRTLRAPSIVGSRGANLSRGEAACRQPLIGGERQEFGELARERDLGEDLRSRFVARAELLQLLPFELGHPFPADAAMPDPLPDLRATDLGGCRVLHPVVDRGRADAVQPGGDVLDTDGD